MVKTGVVHGRFQVLHNDHVKYLMAGKAHCEHLIVGITNPDPTLTRYDEVNPQRSSPLANPLTYYERYLTVEATLAGIGLESREYSVVPFPISVPELYKYYIPLEATFFLTIYDEWGEKKLRMLQSMGLKTHVLWRRPLSEKGLTSTEIRRRIAYGESWEHLVPPAALKVIKEMGLAKRMKEVLTRSYDSQTCQA